MCIGETACEWQRELDNRVARASNESGAEEMGGDGMGWDGMDEIVG